MEIAFFRVGITRTASDQSMFLNSAHSGSFAIEASTSSFVIASKRAQLVFPLRRSPHRRVTTTVFFMPLQAHGELVYTSSIYKCVAELLVDNVDIDGTFRER